MGKSRYSLVRVHRVHRKDRRSISELEAQLEVRKPQRDRNARAGHVDGPHAARARWIERRVVGRDECSAQTCELSSALSQLKSLRTPKL